MAVPYMPLYVADYMADTAHLTTVEHGAYLLLLMTYWQRGEALPDDDRKLARIAGLGPREWQRVRPSLLELFEIVRGGWVHKRVETELHNLRAKSLKKRNGGLARAEQMLSERLALAQLIVDTDTDIEKEERKKGGYAFCGRTVKVSKADFDQWQRSFPDLNLAAQLQARDDWLDQQPDDIRKKWFQSTSSLLAKKQSEAAKPAELVRPIC